MKNKVVNIKLNDPACMGFDDEFLFISTQKEHGDFNELRDFAMSFRKSNTNGYWAIDLKLIKEIIVHEKEPEFFIRYEIKEGKLKKFYFSITDPEIRIPFCESLAKTAILASRQEIVNPYLKLVQNLAIITLILLVTWAETIIATNGSNNSRKVLVRAVTNIIQTIGPIPVCIIGALIALYFVYKIIRTFFNPGKTIKYT